MTRRALELVTAGAVELDEVSIRLAGRAARAAFRTIRRLL